MQRTVRSHVDHQADVRPSKTYLIAPETGMTMSFGELQRDSRRLARVLRDRGAAQGDKIALLMPNGYQTCRLFIGIMYGGFCVTPINLLAQPSQLAYVIEHCDTRIIFVSPDQVERLNLALTQVHREVEVIVVHPDCTEFIEEQREGSTTDESRYEVAEIDDALMMYTSGTTGTPKGVLLSNRSVIAGGEYVSSAHQLGEDDRVMAVLPLYHINAQIVTATSPLVHGGSLVLPQRFSASSFWETVVKHGCTWINVVPTIIAYLINGSSPKEKGLDISRVKFCRSASAPLAPSHHRAFEDKFGIGIIETMGLTETAAPCFTNPLDPARRKIGSPGQAFGNEAKVVDDQGETQPPGQTGEIMVRGPNVMNGYYKNPMETAKSLTSDGWLHTGDLGHLDEDGFVFVTGRLKELIIKGGENIAPREIDEALLKHPALLEAAAVGIPDDNYGQEIMACVVLKPDQTCTEEELRKYCEGALGNYKTPRQFHFVQELPKGPSGKVQRLKLLDLVGPATQSTV
jgi:acyl-CoA synthetase (AMP-forming)/AMP-acid ligase II